MRACEVCGKGGVEVERGPLTNILCPLHQLDADLDLIIATALQLSRGLNSHPETFRSRVSGFIKRVGLPTYQPVIQKEGVLTS